MKGPYGDASAPVDVCAVLQDSTSNEKTFPSEKKDAARDAFELEKKTEIHDFLTVPSTAHN